MKCQHPDARKLFTKKLKEDLAPELADHDTDPTLHSLIVEILKHHRRGTVRRFRPRSYFGDYSRAVEEQRRIGWDGFLLGRWSPRWQEIQARYYRTTYNRKSSKRWATAIIKKMMQIVWDMWQFRNGNVHGEDGIIAKASHARLKRVRVLFIC